MPPGEIKHAVELMELFFSLTGDVKFRDAIKKAQDMEKRGEPLNMRSFLTEAMNDGIAIGRNEGISIGRNEGISIGEARGISIGEARGITIGEQRARRSIMDRLIATGMSPSQAASLTGMNV